MAEISNDMPDRVAKTFNGRIVLLTGGTGFMGKVLLEKLLRMCPDIGGVILLIRQKKGKEAKQRLEQIFQSELFEPLLKERGMDYLVSRTQAVSGDVSELNLGMSAEDRKICQTANVIVHSAASVRFDEGLKKVVILNARGTKVMLDLAKECKNLELFIYVSTAYCHPEQKVLEETTYPSPADPHDIIRMMEETDEDVICSLTPKFLGLWPNTYAYSKALAEELVRQEMDNLPTFILRPSVVVPVFKEPVPGWTDNLNGPAGLLIAAGKGVLRTMYGDPSSFADFIPVDLFANGLIVIAWNFLENGDKEQRVINLISSDEIQFPWSLMLDTGRKLVLSTVPFNNTAWYPGGSMTSNRLWHQTRVVLFHFLPAIFVDTILFCLGIKPVLLRVQRRISKGMEVFEYYTSNQWEFTSNRKKMIRDQLNPKERSLYKVDAEGFDPETYFKDCIICIRRYILRETDDTLPAAKRHMWMMWVVDRLVKLSFCCLVLYWTVKMFTYFNIINYDLLGLETVNIK